MLLMQVSFGAAQGHADIVQQLLVKGADITQSDEEGYQAHHCAAECGQPEALELLLQAGADVSARTHDGKTALHQAAKTLRGHPSWDNRDKKGKVVKLLADAGANLNDCKADSTNPELRLWTPLHHAARCDTATAITALAQAGADLGAVNVQGQSPLCKAAEFGSLAAIRALASAGADLEQPDSQGHTPLLTAVDHGEVGVTAALLLAGANMATQDSKGRTALHIAAEVPDGKFAQLSWQLAWLLVKANAPLDVVNSAGRTPEGEALSSGNTRVHALLKAQRFGPMQK